MKYRSTLVFAMLATTASAQLTITDSLDQSGLATLLEGLNVSILNVEVDCPGVALGHFSGSSELEITEGLLLTTGSAASVASVPGSFLSLHNGTPGDADLEFSLAMESGTTMDACVLEFDCVPMGDTLLFNFSFGSDEYPEFVGSSFNDVFAIWLSGPGYPDPTNVAALPDGTPVAINNVNADLNPAYFHDNHQPPGQFIGYDGFTTNLTVFAVVEPDGIYHFKVAIADVADGVYDSGVFLEAFSFRSVALGATALTEVDRRMVARWNGDVFEVVLPLTAAGVTMDVLDMRGALVMRSTVQEDRAFLDTRSLQDGVYILRIPELPGLAPLRFAKQ
jgi:hypothetical protein